jgi:hypothetical protein
MLGREMIVSYLTTTELDSFIHQQYPTQPNWSSYESEHESNGYDEWGREIDGSGWNEDNLIMLDITGTEVDELLMQNFLRGNCWEGTTKTLLNDLCCQGIIPARTYLIHVIKPLSPINPNRQQLAF